MINWIFQTLRRSLASQRGYTLLELVVAMTIFAIVLVTAVGSFVSVSRSSSKAGAQRSVQQDMRFNIEELSRQARSSQIDYQFYENNTSVDCTLASRRVLALLYTEAGPANDAQTKRVIYYFYGDTANPNNNALYRYESTNTTNPPTCGQLVPTQPNNQRSTADNIRVGGGQFIITPDRNPNNTGSPLSAQYVHPRVSVAMQVASKTTGSVGSARTSQTSAVVVQTTLSTRSYPVSLGNVAGQGNLPPPVFQTSWAVDGSNYQTCDNGGVYYCNTIATSPIPNGAATPIAGAVAHYQTTPGNPLARLTYQTNALAAGTYRFKMSYYNIRAFGNPAPPGYSYNVTVSFNGGQAQTFNMPIAQPGDPPAVTFTSNPLFNVPAGGGTVTITWNNDVWGASGDANLAITRVELLP